MKRQPTSSLGRTRSSQRSGTIRTFGGGQVKIVGVTEKIEVEMRGMKRGIQFLVIEISNSSEEIIMGYDTLKSLEEKEDDTQPLELEFEDIHMII